MRHHLVLSLLAITEAATLLTGAAAAATVTGRAATPSTRVHATQAVAPRVVAVAQPAAVARPAAPRARVHHVAAPRHPSVHRAPRVTVRRTAAKPVLTSLSPLALMQRSIARIPGYHPGDAVWVMTSRFGHWGIADLGTGVIYIEPSVPSNRMYDVVAHEWSHVLSIKAYDGDLNAAVAAMNSYFGGSGLDGAEKAADCMARVLGARWTHYTSCSSATWRAGARRLLSHERL